MRQLICSKFAYSTRNDGIVLLLWYPFISDAFGQLNLLQLFLRIG